MASERVQRQIDRMLDQVEEAAERQDWSRATELAQSVLAVDPDNEDASAFVTLAGAAPAEPAASDAAPSVANGPDAASMSAEARIQILKELVHIAASSLHIEEVFDGVAEQVRKLFAFDHAAVALHHPGDDFLTLRAVVGDLPGGRRSSLEESGSGAVMRSGKPAINPDTLANPQSPRERLVASSYRSILRIPLISRGRAFGVLNFGAGVPNAFGDYELRMAQDVADHLAVVLDYSLRYEEVEEAGREQERARLARELHDSLAQALTGIVMQLDEARERYEDDIESAVSAVGSARDLARESLEDARRSVWDLQPAALESGDLAQALEREARRPTSDGLDISFSVNGAPRRIDRRSEEALLRIAQESLGNVRRHAQAGRAEVSLRYGEADVELHVVDDGVGFDPTAAKPSGDAEGGFGLTSIQQRASLVGGRVEVRSTPGFGTEIRTVIPAALDAVTPPLPTQASEEASPAAPPAEDGRGEPIRVLIVDDHEMVRGGLRQMLEREQAIEVAGEAADGEAALREIGRCDPDVVLLDMQMPGLDGVGTLQRMRELGMEQRTILLSVLAEDEQILAGLRAGARGYVVKDVAREDLCRAIQTVHEGGSLVPPVVAERLLDHLDGAAPERLSPRESDVLQLLATGARNKEIAASLSISENTVRWHVANLHQKLDVTTRTEAVHVARERGLLEG
jgi:signal transduction histidine kinase/DNA-binding NarL/FixJ family response regulator